MIYSKKLYFNNIILLNIIIKRKERITKKNSKYEKYKKIIRKILKTFAKIIFNNFYRDKIFLSISTRKCKFVNVFLLLWISRNDRLEVIRAVIVVLPKSSSRYASGTLISEHEVVSRWFGILRIPISQRNRGAWIWDGDHTAK